MSIADQGAAPARISALPALENPPEVPVDRGRRLAGLLIVLAVAFLPLIMASLFAVVGIDAKLSDSSIRYRYFNGLMMEVTSLALLAYVLRQNCQNFADLGFVFRLTDIVYGMLLWVVAICCYRLAYPTILSACVSCWNGTGPGHTYRA